MSETKTYVFPESGGNGGGSGMLAMLAPLLQQKGIDPNLLVAMQGKNNNGFGGDGSWFMWIIFLFFLFPLFGRNGWGNNGDGGNGGGFAGAGIPNLINNDAGRELLMSAIQGNGQAINNLATNLNCSIGQVQNAINGVMSQVQQVGNQVGQSSMQIINAIQQGNCQIAQHGFHLSIHCFPAFRYNNSIRTKIGYRKICRKLFKINSFLTNLNRNVNNCFHILAISLPWYILSVFRLWITYGNNLPYFQFRVFPFLKDIKYIGLS